jgi:hypothetical protein
MAKRILYSILFLCCFAKLALGQKQEKWIIIKGKVVDTFGYSISNARIALISKNGHDKCIKYTDSFGQFYFKLKKKNIDKYALRCYFFGNSNSNKLLSVNDFITTDKYQVGTNVFYFTSKKFSFSRPHFGIYTVLRCELSAHKSLHDEKYWRNLPVDQTSPTEILKSQYSFLK